MENSKESIIQVIKDHIIQHDGSYPDWNAWYVGITSDPKERLFEEHKVNEKDGAWIYRTAETSSEAREIENYFVNDLKTDGGTGGGNYSTKAIYAYKKTGYTIETA